MSKRIGIVMSSLSGGGAEKMVLNLSQRFSTKGYVIKLYLANKSGDYIDRIPPEIEIFDMGAQRQIGSLFPLIRYLSSDPPDVLLSTGTGMNVISCLAKQISRSDTKLVIRVQNTMSKSIYEGSRPEHRLLPFLVKTLFPTADEIIAISEGVASDLSSITRVDEKDISIIYNPVINNSLLDLAKENPSHKWFKQNDVPIILGVGRLVPQKDFSTLIRAFKRVRENREAKLIILGKGKEKDRLQRLATQLNLTPYISFPGFVENPYAYMSSSDLFVQSPAWEGFGNVLVEAMACGTPVVSTDCPHGPAEILEHGRFGLLVPVGDSKALANAISFTLGSPMPATALQKRAMNFTVERIADEYIDVLLD